MLFRSILKSRFEALPPREKLRRSLLGALIYAIIIGFGFVLWGWDYRLTSIVVVFGGALGVLSTLVVALVNGMKVLNENG